MTDETGDAALRSEERLEKARRTAEDKAEAMAEYHAETKALLDKTAKLRALRLEKERLQAERDILSPPPPSTKGRGKAAIAARAALAAEKVKPAAAKKVIEKVLKAKLAKDKATTAKPAKTTRKAKTPK